MSDRSRPPYGSAWGTEAGNTVAPIGSRAGHSRVLLGGHQGCGFAYLLDEYIPTRVGEECGPGQREHLRPETPSDLDGQRLGYIFLRTPSVVTVVTRF